MGDMEGVKCTSYYIVFFAAIVTLLGSSSVRHPRRGKLRGSTPRLLHIFDIFFFAGGWGVEPHIALQQRSPDVKKNFATQRLATRCVMQNAGLQIQDWL